MFKNPKTKLKAKLVLDLIIFLLYVSLMFSFQINVLFHEITGFVIVLLCAFHLLLNDGVIKAFLKGNLKDPTTVKKLKLDIWLFVLLMLATVTGIFVADAVFVIAAFENSRSFVMWHVGTSYIGMALVIVHFLQHRVYVTKSLQHLFKKKPATDTNN